MIDYELESEEKDLLHSYEHDELAQVTNVEEEKGKAFASAKVTLEKTRNINIRLSEHDLYKLKALALEEGIPYQTLAASILHKATKR